MPGEAAHTCREQHPGDQQPWEAWEGLVYAQLLCRPGLQRSGLGGQAPLRNQAPAEWVGETVGPAAPRRLGL